MKIITFPFAGGNKYSYNYLKKPLFEKGFLIETFEYINKEHGYEPQRLESVDEILDFIFPQFIEAIKDEDYIVYGHSMGALIGYLVCQRIEELQLKKPLKLIVSGRTAPSIKKKDKTHNLPTDLFWDKVYELGGVSEEILKEKELKDFFEPILRADFKTVETYQYKGKANLTISIDVVYGSDENIGYDVLPWKQETNKQITFTELKGNHFFIYEHVSFFVDIFNNSFDKSLIK